MWQLPYVIFDMDGTLLDSTGMWDEVGREVFAHWGKTPDATVRNDTVTLTIEGTAAYFVQSCGIPATVAEVAAMIREKARAAYATETQLKPGVTEVLMALRARGVAMCVASGTEKPLVDAALAHFGIADYFAFTTACTNTRGKQSPEVYLQAMQMLGAAEPARVAVFEDSPTAVRTAKKAGFYTVAVHDSHNAAQWPQTAAVADAAVQSWPQFAATL